ncbi:MAG: DNA polymerase III subunit chi [Sphingopyxis sp.]
MARVDFYHLPGDAVAPVLARLAQAVLGGGNQLLIVAADPAARDAIDNGLWTAMADSFLPHAPAATPIAQQGAEPIAIADTLGDDAVNGAKIVALADGEWRDAALNYDRVLFLFNSRLIDDARAAWRRLTKSAGVAKSAGVECHYWRQDGAGRWREGP